uniref:Putative cysteine synthase YGR012W n=1 Tax=Ogataea thermomethanolica (nom. inval.) TaxID=310468 RepID=A0A6B9D212_9ASCO|nr:putative cysteine synthase YGR012W [Ogataea thermomethanolica (nom. inval.)]
MELCNPGGSSKDRVALAIIRNFQNLGMIRPNTGDIIFEGTSGSTGISIAMLCKAMGYSAHICLPDDTSEEKLNLLHMYGATVQKVKPASIVDPNQYVNAARQGAIKVMGDQNTSIRAVFADQFENECNWKVHYDTTGPEIWEQTKGSINYLVSGSGTGGTISGCSMFLKGMNSTIKTILADPQGSGLYNRVKHGIMYDSVEREGTRRRHQVDTLIEGIGLNRITHNFAKGEAFIDGAEKVTDSQAMMMARFLNDREGLFLGSSSCINAVAACRVAYNSATKGDTIVFFACDSGNRHVSKFWKAAMCCKVESDLKNIIGL